MPPSAWRAMIVSASSSAVRPSAASTARSRSRIAAGPIRRKSKRCSRDSTGAAVSAIFCGSVVAKTKTTPGGGSSRILRSAFHASRVEHVGLVDDVDLVVALPARRRTSRARADPAHRPRRGWRRRRSRPHRGSPSRPRSGGRLAHSPHGSPVGVAGSGRSQLSAMARIRAAVVLPTPRGPVSR